MEDDDDEKGNKLVIDSKCETDNDTIRNQHLLLLVRMRGPNVPVKNNTKLENGNTDKLASSFPLSPQ